MTPNPYNWNLSAAFKATSDLLFAHIVVEYPLEPSVVDLVLPVIQDPNFDITELSFRNAMTASRSTEGISASVRLLLFSQFHRSLVSLVLRRREDELPRVHYT